MRCACPPDVQYLVDQQMAGGRYSSEDELLRAALQSLDAGEADLIAIQDAMTEMQAGDTGVPLQIAFQRVRNSGF